MSAYDDALRELGLDGEDMAAIEDLTVHLVAQDFGWLRELVRLREEAGLTQEDVARAWGRDGDVVADFEKLGADPRLSTIRRYAASVGIRYTHSVELDRGVHPGRSAAADRNTPPFYLATRARRVASVAAVLLAADFVVMLVLSATRWHPGYAETGAYVTVVFFVFLLLETVHHVLHTDSSFPEGVQPCPK